MSARPGAGQHGLCIARITTTRNIDPGEGRLLDRLLAGDATAPADLAESYLEDLVGRLARAYPRVEEHVVITAAIDALLGVASHPERVELAKGALRSYLLMAARGDLLNALRASRRRREREQSIELVEVAALERNIQRDGSKSDPTSDAALAAVESSSVRRDVDGVAQSDAEAAVLQMMLEGERRTVVYAAILNLKDLDPVAQRTEVKKVKDRLKLRLRRLRGNHRE